MNLLHRITAFGNPAQRLAHSSHATGVTSGAVPGLGTGLQALHTAAENVLSTGAGNLKQRHREQITSSW